MWYVIAASFTGSTELAKNPGIFLWPKEFMTGAYKLVFSNPLFMNSLRNTLEIILISLPINIVMTLICGYFMACTNVMWKKPISRLILFTMFFGGGLIPFYLTVKNVGLDNTLWALIIPYSVNVYNMVIMRTTFVQLPEALIESSKLDGANPMQILVKIVMPLSVPVMMVIMLYYTVAQWNSWFPAMIFLHDRAKFPLQLILREILIQNDTATMMQGVGMQDAASVGETIQYAVIVVATVPILVIYPFIQRFFTEGVMIGAVKG